MTNKTVISISASSVAKAILVIIAFYIGYLLRDLLLVFLAAVVIASAMEPMIEWFIDRRFPRLAAVITLYVGVSAILALSFYSLFIPLLQDFSSLLTTLPSYLNSAELWKPLQSIGIGSGNVPGLVNDVSIQELANKVNETISSTGGVWGSFSAIFGGLLGFILVFVVSFYLSVQEKGIENFLKAIVPLKHRKYVVNVWNRAEKKIGLWLQGQLVLAVVVAVLVFLALSLLQVRNALLLAVLAGLFEIIPIFGAILAAIPAIAIGLIDGGWSLALLIAGAYVIIQQFEANLIYPVVVKKVVGVSPIIVILALIAGAKIAGFLGILLSVPVAAVLVEIFNDMSKGKKIMEK